MDLKQISSWMGSPSGLRIISIVSMRMLVIRVLNCCSWSCEELRRKRYCPLRMIEARISMFEQKMEITLFF